MAQPQPVPFRRPEEEDGQNRYTCCVCGWQGTRTKIYPHARLKHQGQATLGEHKKKRTAEDVAQQAAKATRQYRERKKVSRPISFLALVSSISG